MNQHNRYDAPQDLFHGSFEVNGKLTCEQILNIRFLAKDEGIAIATCFSKKHSGGVFKRMSVKIFKTLIPRNRCVQVICMQPQNRFFWNHTNSQLHGIERGFPQYDFVTNCFVKEYRVVKPIHWVQRTWEMKEITSVMRPNVLGYVIRTPRVGSLLSWTPYFKTFKNSVTSVDSYSNRGGVRAGESVWVV